MAGWSIFLWKLKFIGEWMNVLEIYGWMDRQIHGLISSILLWKLTEVDW